MATATNFSENRVPVTIVTGFLGAGKTSLIRQLLADAREPGSIALIINEFGEETVDGDVLRDCDARENYSDLLELSNGCICCTVAEDFLPAITSLLERENPPQAIIIETSGLALPQPLIRAFNWPSVKTRSSVDGVVVVVDGPALLDGNFSHSDIAKASDQPQSLHDDPVIELFEDQLVAADLVVLSKCDQLNEQQIESAESQLRHDVRDGVEILRSSSEGLPSDCLLGMNSAAQEHLIDRQSHHEAAGEDDHDHDDFHSFVLTSEGEFGSKDDILKKLENISALSGLLRVKGRAFVAGKKLPLHVQGVGPRIDSWFANSTVASRETRLVCIAKKELAAERITSVFHGG